MDSLVQYRSGDVREPVEDGKIIIIHCCNDLGKMGAGVAKALFLKWSAVRDLYIRWHQGGEKFENKPFKLGEIQAIKVEDNIAVVNMIAQHGIYPDKNKIAPIRYLAMGECLAKVAKIAKKYNAQVVCPYKMGADLAGGDWKVIERLLEGLVIEGIPVTAYDIQEARFTDYPERFKK